MAFNNKQSPYRIVSYIRFLNDKWKTIKTRKTNGLLAFTCFRFNINEGYRVTHQEYGWDQIFSKEMWYAAFNMFNGYTTAQRILLTCHYCFLLNRHNLKFIHCMPVTARQYIKNDWIEAVHTHPLTFYLEITPRIFYSHEIEAIVEMTPCKFRSEALCKSPIDLSI